MPAIWRLTPRQSGAAECERRGKAAVVAGCIDLLQGRQGTDDALLIALAGPAAQAVLDGSAGGKEGYWPRVWAARGLLHAWDDRATAVMSFMRPPLGTCAAPQRPPGAFRRWLRTVSAG